jgi:hypothetical protein
MPRYTGKPKTRPTPRYEALRSADGYGVYDNQVKRFISRRNMTQAEANAEVGKLLDRIFDRELAGLARRAGLI